MCKRNAFTLIELLVVIAIISLLMSVLTAALIQARKRAKTVVCQLNLEQWGAVWLMYINNNDGYFNYGYQSAGQDRRFWPNTLKPYYNDRKLLLCPSATKPWSRGAVIGRPDSAWGEVNSTCTVTGVGSCSTCHTAERYEALETCSGSYGLNEWVCNVEGRERMRGANWKTATVMGAARIPLLMDCSFYNGWPDYYDGPPAYSGDFVSGMGDEEHMVFFCIDRHNRRVNGLFVDFSVQNINLKHLWSLKWHRLGNRGADPPVWPEWMRSFEAD